MSKKTTTLLTMKVSTEAQQKLKSHGTKGQKYSNIIINLSDKIDVVNKSITKIRYVAEKTAQQIEELKKTGRRNPSVADELLTLIHGFIAELEGATT